MGRLGRRRGVSASGAGLPGDSPVVPAHDGFGVVPRPGPGGCCGWCSFRSEGGAGWGDLVVGEVCRRVVGWPDDNYWCLPSPRWRWVGVSACRGLARRQLLVFAQPTLAVGGVSACRGLARRQLLVFAQPTLAVGGVSACRGLARRQLLVFAQPTLAVGGVSACRGLATRQLLVSAQPTLAVGGVSACRGLATRQLLVFAQPTLAVGGVSACRGLARRQLLAFAQPTLAAGRGRRVVGWRDDNYWCLPSPRWRWGGVGANVGRLDRPSAVVPTHHPSVGCGSRRWAV